MAEAILAKSYSDGTSPITLADHTRSVLEATEIMFGKPGEPTRLAECWLRFFRLDAADFDAFYQNLWLAAAFHDLGKANSGFQAMMQKPGQPQAIRHEHLSALLLWSEPLRSWLYSLGHGVDPEIVVSAVVSHHLKVRDQGQWALAAEQEGAALKQFVVHAAAPEVTEVLQMASQWGKNPAPDIHGLDGRWTFGGQVAAIREDFERAMYRFRRSLKSDERRERLLIAVKAGVIAVDSAGSGVVRVEEQLEDWLGTAFKDTPLTAESIEDGIIAERVRQIESQLKTGNFHFQDFQLAAADLGPRALLLAPCGAGKTLAAWKWVAAQLRNRPASRVIFLYPTRATATEGFRDYVAGAGPEDAALVTGTARYELETMLINPDEPREAREYIVDSRLFSLGYWQRSQFSATADSFLALMNNVYAALCMAPLLADSIIVVDEVHSFSPSMFRSLEAFLKFFDVPVLCMTASLPEDRITVLRDSCQMDVFPPNLANFPELQEQAQVDRYRVHWISADEAQQRVTEALAQDKKVMWVVNTVARCQAAAQALLNDPTVTARKIPILCYHSRFRLEDRKQRHEEVMSTFKSGTGPMVLVTTQVCEMSLDLDADVLITEAAPVPSLIQRMGRCNRHWDVGRLGEVSLYEPAGVLPYAKEEIAEGRAFAQEMAARTTVSHADLSDYLRDKEVTAPFVENGFTGLLNSGWYAVSGEHPFREDDGYIVESVLNGDVAAYLAARRAGQGAADGYVLPAPRNMTEPDATGRLPRYMRIAPSAQYDDVLGLQEKEARVDG